MLQDSHVAVPSGSVALQQCDLCLQCPYANIYIYFSSLGFWKKFGFLGLCEWPWAWGLYNEELDMRSPSELNLLSFVSRLNISQSRRLPNILSKLPRLSDFSSVGSERPHSSRGSQLRSRSTLDSLHIHCEIDLLELSVLTSDLQLFHIFVHSFGVSLSVRWGHRSCSSLARAVKGIRKSCFSWLLHWYVKPLNSQQYSLRIEAGIQLLELHRGTCLCISADWSETSFFHSGVSFHFFGPTPVGRSSFHFAKGPNSTTQLVLYYSRVWIPSDRVTLVAVAKWLTNRKGIRIMSLDSNRLRHTRSEEVPVSEYHTTLHDTKT